MSKLPPLPSKIDEEFEATKETVELQFKRCEHKDTQIKDNKLICKCGAGWEGSNLHHLQKLFNSR